MPSFVTDSTVLVPGLLDVDSRERRLLVLCLYGQMLYYATFGAEEIDRSPEARRGGVVYGPTDDLRHRASEGAALLAEHLPSWASDDAALLVLSTPILDGLERTLRRQRVGLGLGLTAEHAQRLRLDAGRLVASAPGISLGALPPRTHDRECDLLIETAAQARADFVVSDSPRIEPFHGRDVPYEDHVAGAVRVCSLEAFLNHTQLAWKIDEVDGGLLHFGLGL